ncbi:MAG: hypothetical protein AAF591_02930 [Verrucomicrobiota bacterium]
MLSKENLTFLFLVYGVPALVGGLCFLVGWSRGLKREMFSNERRSLLDAVGLCVAYVWGHYALKGWDGVPPRLGENWLPWGVALAGVLILLRKRERDVRGGFWVWVSLVFLATLGAMLGSLAYYADVVFWKRLGVLAAFFVGALIFYYGLVLIAEQLRAGDFFLFLFIMLGMAAAFFYTTNSITMGQLVVIPIVAALPAFVVAMRRKDYRVTTLYAYLAGMIFSCLMSYNHFGAAVSPPVSTLVLWMLAPGGAYLGMVLFSGGRGQALYLTVVYLVMFAVSTGALVIARRAFEPAGY